MMPHTSRSLRWLVLGLLVFLSALFLKMLRPVGTLSVSADGGPHTAAANTAPDPPVLVQPANGATGVSVPLLQVNVTDPDPDALCVTFYGRPAAADFTLVVIPDPQNETMFNPAMFNSQTQWMVAQKSTRHIVFATCVGDLVNLPTDGQYGNVDTAMDYLDAGNVPYSLGPGNHDLYDGGTLYESWFGVARFSGKSWYGGHYGSTNLNSYSLFSTSGMDFILINLQYNPGSAQRDWADGLLKTYSNRRGIVVQHDVLYSDNSWVNQTTYNELRDNPNLFLMLCGHEYSSGDGAAYVAGTGTDGHTIHVVLADYQNFSSGNGWLRILRFMPPSNVISMTTYSPYTGGSITTSPDQMELSYGMGGEAFTGLGTVCNVSSGGSAYLLWSGLSSYTRYEWYAIVSDGTASTTGPTWSFTTGTPTAVQLTSFTAQAAREHIVVNWDTAGGLDILGFHIYRATSPDGRRERLTAGLLTSHAPGSASDGHYQYVDETTRAGATYYYWLEELDVNGATQLYGPVSARENLYIKPPPARH
jgi:hypothetical protein